MVTKEQALTETQFHYGNCKKIVGPRGGETFKVERWRASGRCQTWKTRPNEFRLPIKFGLYQSHEITHLNAAEFHVESACPAEI